jgi:GntR family transcriptional regulator
VASKYDRIAADLRSKIRSGEYTGQLPAETRLALHYRVALNTLRRALDVLEGEGLVSSQQGTGTFVRGSRQRIRRNHAQRYQWEKERARQPEDKRKATGAMEKDTGLALTDLAFETKYTRIEAPSAVAQRFKIDIGTPLLRREYRTGVKTEGTPLNLVTSYLVVDQIDANPAILDPSNEPWPGGTHHQLSTVGIEIDHIMDEITARPPQADEMLELGLEPGVAVIVLWKTSVDTTGKVVEVSEVILPGDRTQIEYSTQLKRWK